jgi:hypothetical protein
MGVPGIGGKTQGSGRKPPVLDADEYPGRIIVEVVEQSRPETEGGISGPEIEYLVPLLVPGYIFVTGTKAEIIVHIRKTYFCIIDVACRVGLVFECFVFLVPSKTFKDGPLPSKLEVLSDKFIRTLEVYPERTG